MAGAVSAGAYNAGVFDFLVQALEEWEAAKEKDRQLPETERTVPNHQILIPVVTGASAGGSTAALGLFGLSEKTSLPSQTASKATKYVIPALYKTWVQSLHFTDGKNENTLLGTADLKGADRVASLLNSSVLSNTAKSVIQDTTINALPRPYFTDNLHVFLTITNLRGIPYGISFTGAGHSDTHLMSVHADRVHYCFSGLGSGKFDSAWLNTDRGISITAQQIKFAFSKDGSAEQSAERFVRAALATVAFPIGLAAKNIVTHSTEYEERAWPELAQTDRENISPIWPSNSEGETSYDVPYVGVDGGVINNEPFEIARWTIMKTPGKRNEPFPETADRAVLLVDPFPQFSSFDPDLTPAESALKACLREVLFSLFPTLKNQARVKTTDLARTANTQDVFSRFLIAPARKIENGSTSRDAPYPLATGVLGAFGGFLSERFPEHDYQLGRKNCQSFLRKYFCLEQSNPVFQDWPENSDARHSVILNDKTYKTLIPLFNSANNDIPNLSWPTVDEAVVNEFIEAVRTRGNAVISLIAKTEFETWYMPWITRGIWWVKRHGALKHIKGMLLADLIRRNQYVPYTGLESDMQRDVIACLHVLKETDCTIDNITNYISRKNSANPLLEKIQRRQVYDVLNNQLTEFITHHETHQGAFVLSKESNTQYRKTILSKIKNIFR